MCGVPEAQLALSVFSTVAKFQNDKFKKMRLNMS